MGTSIRLGRVLGVPISVHFSWVIIFLLLTFVMEAHYGRERQFLGWSSGERWAAAVATSLLLFVSVLVHELSHSLMAMRKGIPVNGITLFILGGVSQIAREAKVPSTEFLVTVVGPASSVVLGFIFLGISFALDGVSQHLSAIARTLGYMNIVMVGVFNLFPCFPMDGGRLMRAIIWRITRSYWTATRLATRGGQIISLSMIVAGTTMAALYGSYLLQWLWLAGIGVFLYMLASASYRQYRLRESLRGHTAAEVMTCTYPETPTNVTLADLKKVHPGHPVPEFLVVTDVGRPRGVITRRMVERVPKTRWAEVRVGDMMMPLDVAVSVDPHDAACDVVELLDGEGVEGVVVMEGDVLIGIINRRSLQYAAKAPAISCA